MRTTVMLITGLMLCVSIAGAAEIELLRVKPDSFSKTGGVISILEGSSVSGIVIRTTSLANWQRGGLQIGPLPAPTTHYTVEYEFRPIRFGAQGQEFTSQTPSTHWYMLFADPSGRMHLFTRSGGKWEQRAASTKTLSLNAWYHARVTLTRVSISVQVSDKATGETVWETPTPVPVDDLGEETTFVLCDEAPEADACATAWREVVLSTDDHSLAEKLTARLKKLAQEQAEEEQRKRSAQRLRERGIALLPTPQEVKFQSGTYRLPEIIYLAAEQGCGEAEIKAVRTAIADTLGKTVRLATRKDKPSIILTRLANTTQADDRMAQAYRLQVETKGITLTARTPHGFFNGAQTLCQLVAGENRAPALVINDYPAIAHRLVMIAIDQGGFQVVDVNYWKRILRELSSVKITHVMPYFEGAGFLFSRFPFMTYKGENGFTKEKARELSEYAHQRFIELTPQLESLGHAGAMLSHEELKDLRESGDVFCSSNPRTFEFLGALFDELVDAFPYSRYIHVGGDEFGHGFARCSQCKARAEAIGKPALYAEHIMRLRQMLKERRRDTMIWWHEEGYTEEAAERLAKDIVVFDWHYGNQPSYPSLHRLQEKGFALTWATPAVTRFYDGSNDFSTTFGNIQGFLRAAAKANVPGECTCTWVHGIWGGRNLFELNLYALLWSAECAWNPAASDEDAFRWKFAHHWFGLEGKDRAEEVLYAVHAPYGAPREQGFWRSNGSLEPILGESPAATAKRLTEHPELVQQAWELLKHCARARAILEKWQKEVRRNRVTVDFLLHDVHIHEAAARKLIAIGELSRAWEVARSQPPAERAATIAPALEKLRALVQDLHEIEAMFNRSVLEAGGGECGWGGWIPFVAKGGILFRASEGRTAIENLLQRLQQLQQKEDLLPLPW